MSECQHLGFTGPSAQPSSQGFEESFSQQSFHHCTSAIRRRCAESFSLGSPSFIAHRQFQGGTSKRLRPEATSLRSIGRCLIVPIYRPLPYRSNLSKAFHTSRITFEQDRHQADCDILLALGWCYLAHCKHQRNKAFLHLSHHIGAREALYHFFVIYYRPWAGVSS